MNPAPPENTPFKGLRFAHVAIVGKYQAPGSRHVVEDIAHFLHDQGCDVSLEQDTALNTGLVQYPALDVSAIGRSCQLALVVGGDGTMLGIGRQLARYGVPLVGINQGRLGFITDIPIQGYREKLGPILRGAYEEDPRALMAAGVWRDGRCVFEATALNDVVVNRGGVASMIELRVEVDGHFVANQRADGLIIATSTGSTAYALSAGGPILYPALNAMVLAPINPHTLSNRPIVISGDSLVEIAFRPNKEFRAQVNCDNVPFPAVAIEDCIEIRKAERPFRILHPTDYDFFQILRLKLNWSNR